MEGFRLPGDTSVEDIESTLAELRAIIPEEPTSSTYCYYDTFDWRLHGRALVLRRCGEELTLISFRDGERQPTLRWVDQPTFVWDLPSGEFRQTLEPIIKARALLALASIKVEEMTYRVLNRDEKTVARVGFVNLRTALEASVPATATYVTVRPLRGYEGHARRLAKALSPGRRIASLDEAIYHDALAAAELRPNSYSAKLNFELKPSQRADEATKVILGRLLETIRTNEDGIRADIDIEYLHDYRVAIRRTRSALSQIRGVFPAETTERFKRDFRELGRRTNQLRDLDVYLLAEPDYRAMLPSTIEQDIGPLFDLLRSQRVTALEHVIEGLDGAEYEDILSDWRLFLDQPGVDDPTAPNAAVPVIDLARRRIYKRYRRIVKDGTYILDHTEDELLHALRLECKKLRYLLEFFASLFPPKESRRLIRQLKRLQENLGDFTDLSVQQISLMAMADQLPDDDPRTRRALIATGALVETLARRQQAVKADFADIFKRFAAPANQRAYRELFASKKSRGKGKTR